MNLLSLFLLRLRRNHVFLALIGLAILLPLAVTYRNVLTSEQLKREDRVRITQIKQEAEAILYPSDPQLPPVPAEMTESYERLLALATSYLEKEYLQGKSQAVLEVELALYDELEASHQHGGASHQYSPRELAEKIAVYRQVVDQALSFHYPSAPRDFYLTLLQLLPASSYLLPLLTLCLLVWILATDLSRHRGLLFANGISAKQYATALTLLALVIQLTVYAVAVTLLLALARYFDFTFHSTYPILVTTSSGSLVTVMDRLQTSLLEMAGLTCLYLLLIRFGTAWLIQVYQKR